MRLKDFFTPGTVKLALQSATRDDVLRELVSLLEVSEVSAETLLRALQRRESLGATAPRGSSTSRSTGSRCRTSFSSSLRRTRR